MFSIQIYEILYVFPSWLWNVKDDDCRIIKKKKCVAIIELNAYHAHQLVPTPDEDKMGYGQNFKSSLLSRHQLQYKINLVPYT